MTPRTGLAGQGRLPQRTCATPNAILPAAGTRTTAFRSKPPSRVYTITLKPRSLVIAVTPKGAHRAEEWVTDQSEHARSHIGIHRSRHGAGGGRGSLRSVGRAARSAAA